ncbi:organic cation/carnitine transporter 2-like isoform X2 [Stegostoma tigrinum]|uniref:organic cation/carnitine transporter 2-like isoform X2 n=1 Tax=Stegostoma tigrinum TaxID=3053191 RepID=UPI00287057ED|nr:organic cation/carnitine transporter 2-like isoform X2 [Stegostoma tigrinum]
MDVQDYDELTAFLGSWGPFQKTIFFLLSVIIIPNGYTGLCMVFVGDTPQHHCRLPDSPNSTFEESKLSMNLSLRIPIEERDGEQVYSRCTKFKTIVGDRSSDTAREIEPCSDGWVYSTDRYISTIVSEWNLVCDDNWKGPFTVSVLFLGMLCGSFISGQISDRYGRKLILFVSMTVHTASSLLLVTSQSWEMFATLFFIVGLAQIARYIVMFILGSELLGKAERIAFGTVGVCLFYAVGYVVLPIFAYFIRDWRMLLIALSLPQILYIPLWWFIPESPRWLLSQGRVEEAIVILKAAAKRNGITTTAEMFENIGERESILPDENTHAVTYLDLVRTANIRNITIFAVLVWMISSVGYFGLSFNTPNMHGDPYINCFISAATEIASYVTAWILLHVSPRRISLACIVVCSGVMLLLIQVIPSRHYVVTMVMAMVGKFGYAAAFSMVYVFSTELYPTVVRNMGVAACSTAAMISTIISPYFAYLGMHDKVLPFILMGSLSITAGIFCLVLPETYGQPLPQTIDQVQPILCCTSSREDIATEAEKDKNAENEQTVNCQMESI